jgi:4-diphosphocytidyl-2-C-methyl-D-erythritol kinase
VAAGSEPAASPHSEIAPAKVNLFLHVIGRRDDGYHLLESLVAFASVGDRITAAAGRGGETEFAVEGRFASAIGGAPSDNLVLKAAAAMRAATGRTDGVRLTLQKNLPVAAGIGGGSADAAAALKALNALWDAGMDVEDLSRIGLGLGADVPVCLRRGAVIMRGIGEDLTPAPLPGAPGIVLVNPLKPLPTPAVFAEFRATEPFAAVGALDWLATRDPAGWFERLARTGNGLQPPALRLLPQIGDMLAALEALPACRLARMSGSGATCFGLFDDWATAARRADDLATAHPGWWVAPGRLLA